ncbi:MAG TPA: CbiX/SirB N-terminal domain-containing protein [Burkholderiales bacterium]|nr:CbiX/SirB N-terminal domain-containing protein [Burkholderiales bacterium]
MKSALVLFAHGSRDPQWAAPLREVQKRVASSKPEMLVELAFLEMMRPTLAEAVDKVVAHGGKRVTIAPLFMAQGAHVKRDLDKLVADMRAQHQSTEFVLLPPAGEVAAVIVAISDWLCEST